MRSTKSANLYLYGTRVVRDGDNACGLKSDSTAWCWGDNYSGLLGDGTGVSSLVPVQVDPGELAP